MKQPGVLLVLVIFVAAVSFVVGSEQYKNGRMKTTVLNGANALPTIGDPDGSGVFKFAIKPEENQFCYELNVSNVGIPTAATVGIGSRGNTGPTLLTLQPPSHGTAKDCLTLDADKISELNSNLGNYYVSVQTEEFPNGAVRGQMK